MRRENLINKHYCNIYKSITYIYERFGRMEITLMYIAVRITNVLT